MSGQEINQSNSPILDHLELPTFEEAVCKTFGHSKNVTIVRLGTERGALEVARETGRSLREIRDIVKHWTFCLKCQPPSWLSKSDSCGPVRDLRGHVRHSNGLALIEATCMSCREKIPSREDRVFVSATFTYQDFREDGGSADRLLMLGSAHCCMKCVSKLSEFRIPNERYLSESEIRALNEEMALFSEEMRKFQDEKSKSKATLERIIKTDLASGNTRMFNSEFSTRPADGDLLERAVTVSEKIEMVTTNVSDTLASKYGVGSHASGLEVQRAKVSDYLKEPRSRGKLLPDDREAGRLWSGGLSEAEIARKLGIKHPSTIHDRIAKVKKLAFAAR
jgi:hypothetical protein